MTIPEGFAGARPFVPSRDFEASKAFYQAFGFGMAFEGEDVAIFTVGAGGFILQRFYQKQLAENFMMQLAVDDIDGWWAHIEALDLPARFGVPPPRAPAPQPWGLTVAYVVDPTGVLWHVTSRPGAG